MSLILDALRKSEAERRRGQSPDLYGATIPSAAPRRDGFRQWPILAGGALLLLAIALLFWPRAQPGADNAAITDESTMADRAGATTGDHDGAAAAAKHVEPPTLAAPVLRGPVPPVRIATPLPPARTAFVAAPAAAPTPSPGTATAQPPIAAPVTPVSASIEPPPPASVEPAPPRNDLPTLAILAPGERAALPPLKLSMHVWNSDPGQRFAIVDGQRLTEGATIGGAVVAEIRRDGVVLDVNGRRVLLPRP